MAPRRPRTAAPELSSNSNAKAYDHLRVVHPMRPEVGTQPQFKKRKPPKTYRYDSSLAPAMEWDTNPVREEGEKLIADILDAKTIEEAKAAASTLKAMSKPFLNWAGKAERLSLDVPTLPLFIHGRLSTKAIMATIQDRKRDKQMELDLFADPQHSVTDQILKAYEHCDKWTNRIILGDSLVVMNSLLEYEGMAGKVQMIYIDPPYGVGFGSNFQPFVRRRDVKHNDDQHMTREPEMVQAYRDTWELGLHSYLAYLRDRLLLARNLLSESGSVFVQISDDNLHHVRELMDEVFGAENFCAQIAFKCTDPLGQKGLARVYDYIIWFAKEKERMKFFPLFRERDISDDREYRYIDDPKDPKGYRVLSDEEFKGLTSYAGVFRRRNLTSSGFTESCTFPLKFKGTLYSPPGGKSWATNKEGIDRLIKANRLFVLGKDPYYKQYQTDFPWSQLENCWTDKPAARSKLYVVETAEKFIARCMLMTTEPGDLVLDPTCGSGTTAYTAEKWGRRWITIDASRVPLALTRQRLLTGTYDYFALKNEELGPAGGFVYVRRKNNRSEEVGGLVPHITLRCIAQDELPEEEVLVDRPEPTKGVTRVTGPFVFEATIPVPFDGEAHRSDDMRIQGEEPSAFVDKMLEVLRRSPTLRIDAKHEIKLKDIRRPTKTLSLSAEAVAVNGKEQPIAFVFGPENGSISESLVYSAAKEAHAKSYSQLIAVGFAIEPNARLLVDRCDDAVGIKAMYVQATPDLMMGDLLKTMRSSQIFSVCGLPDFRIKKIKSKAKGDPVLYQVVLDGLDTFDATSMDVSKLEGNDVPAWFLDTNYNSLVFHVDQAFFPRTGAWENLRKSLKGIYDEDVWKHLAGNTSALFEGGISDQIAVKVIDERGNELVTVKSLKEAEG